MGQTDGQTDIKLLLQKAHRTYLCVYFGEYENDPVHLDEQLQYAFVVSHATLIRLLIEILCYTQTDIMLLLYKDQ